MEEIIKIGTILIAEGAILPESLLVESEPYAYGWRLVKNLDSKGFDRIISQAGWNFIYLASAIETSAFGSDEKKDYSQGSQTSYRENEIKEFQLPGNYSGHRKTIFGTALCECFSPLAANSKKHASFRGLGQRIKRLRKATPHWRLIENKRKAHKGEQCLK